MSHVPRDTIPALVLTSAFLLTICGACRSNDTNPPASGTSAQPVTAQTDAGRATAASPGARPQALPQPAGAAARERDVAVEPEGVPPAITAPPTDLNLIETGPSFFKVVATGTPPLSYLWTKEGRPGFIGNESELWFASPKIEDSGTYSVEVSNRWGKTSATCKLTVSPRPR